MATAKPDVHRIRPTPGAGLRDPFALVPVYPLDPFIPLPGPHTAWAVLCPAECGTELVIPPEYSGAQVECPTCGFIFTAPRPPKERTVKRARLLTGRAGPTEEAVATRLSAALQPSVGLVALAQLADPQVPVAKATTGAEPSPPLASLETEPETPQPAAPVARAVQAPTAEVVGEPPARLDIPQEEEAVHPKFSEALTALAEPPPPRPHRSSAVAPAACAAPVARAKQPIVGGPPARRPGGGPSTKPSTAGARRAKRPVVVAAPSPRRGVRAGFVLAWVIALAAAAEIVAIGVANDMLYIELGAILPIGLVAAGTVLLLPKHHE